jgi:nucleoid-associated protein YgaU
MKLPALLSIVGGLAVIAAGAAWFLLVDRSAPPSPPQATTTATVPSAPVPALTPPPPSKPPTSPSFDVVRVNPDGRAVIAGRAAPGSRVTVLDGDQPIGSVDADPRGEWVLLPDQPLNSGTRQLTLRAQGADGQQRSGEQSVVLNVPQPKDGGPAGTLAVVVPNGSGGSVVLQTPQNSAGLARSGELVLGSVDYDEHGDTRVNGKAPAGSTVQIYLNNKLAGRTQAGADGNWHIVPGEPVPPGTYNLRVDRVQNDGKVLSRLEVPFVRTDKGELLTQIVAVVPGNSLWRIAQRLYGEGTRYSVIYEANRAQIKDPDLIYPGQVFVLPKLN